MGSSLRTYAPLGLFLAGAFALFGLQLALRQDWVPFDTLRTAPLVFLHYRFPHAALWWDRFAIVYALWTFAGIFCMFCASSIARGLGKRFLIVVIAVQGLSLAAMLSSPLPLDSDQYAYVYYASLTQRGVNPYGHYSQPLRLTQSEKAIAAHWGNPPYVDRYGAAWTLANAAVLWPLRNAPVELQARVLRATAALAALACTVLFWIAFGPFPWRPAALLAFALNPLVIVASGNGGHNDVYMLLLGLCAYVAARHRKYEIAAALLALSVQTKFAYAPFILPLLAVAFATTRSWLRTTAAALCFAAVVLVVSLPFTLRLSLYDVARAFNSARQPLFSYMPARVFYHLGLRWVTPDIVGFLFPLFALACAAAISWQALRLRRVPLLEFALLFSLLLLPYKLEGWYGVALAPMLLIQRRSACAAYLGVTVGCEFMQQRMFFAVANPYLIALAIGAAIGGAVWYAMQRTAHPLPAD